MPGVLVERYVGIDDVEVQPSSCKVSVGSGGAVLRSLLPHRTSRFLWHPHRCTISIIE
jgi:hypothetical protein